MVNNCFIAIPGQYFEFLQFGCFAQFTGVQQMQHDYLEVLKLFSQTDSQSHKFEAPTF